MPKANRGAAAAKSPTPSSAPSAAPRVAPLAADGASEANTNSNSNVRFISEVTDKIPLPLGRAVFDREFDKLTQIKQSIFISWHGDGEVRKKILFALNRYKKKHPGTDFVTQREIDPKYGAGTRVWLTAIRSALASTPLPQRKTK